MIFDYAGRAPAKISLAPLYRNALKVEDKLAPQKLKGLEDSAARGAKRAGLRSWAVAPRMCRQTARGSSGTDTGEIEELLCRKALREGGLIVNSVAESRKWRQGKNDRRQRNHFC